MTKLDWMAIKTYWQKLSIRERWMGGIGSIFLIGYLFYALIYSPLTASVVQKAQELQEKKETLAWMKQIRAENKNKHSSQLLTNNQLLTVITTQLNSASFNRFPYQLQQTNSGDIQLTYAEVPYNAFLKWFFAISQEYVFITKQFDVERNERLGIVKVTLVIAAGKE